MSFTKFLSFSTYTIFAIQYTVSMRTLEMLMRSLNGIHPICLIIHTTSLYLINVQLLLLNTRLFLRILFLSLFLSPCILSLCLLLLTQTLSHTTHLLMTNNHRCLLTLTKYLSYITVCNHVLVMSMHRHLRTCINLMTIRQGSCLSHLR